MREKKNGENLAVLPPSLNMARLWIVNRKKLFKAIMNDKCMRQGCKESLVKTNIWSGLCKRHYKSILSSPNPQD